MRKQVQNFGAKQPRLTQIHIKYTTTDKINDALMLGYGIRLLWNLLSWRCRQNLEQKQDRSFSILIIRRLISVRYSPINFFTHFSNFMSRTSVVLFRFGTVFKQIQHNFRKYKDFFFHLPLPEHNRIDSSNRWLVFQRASGRSTKTELSFIHSFAQGHFDFSKYSTF